MKIILVPINQSIKIVGNVYADEDKVLDGRVLTFKESGQFVTAEVQTGVTLCYVGLESDVVEKAIIASVLKSENAHTRLLKEQKDLLSRSKKSGKEEAKLQDVEAKLRQHVN